MSGMKRNEMWRNEQRRKRVRIDAMEVAVRVVQRDPQERAEAAASAPRDADLLLAAAMLREAAAALLAEHRRRTCNGHG